MAGIEILPTVALTDTELVARSRAGESTAFAQIVARYQSLICAITYCATGNRSQSEDLAQETFLIAWKKLPELREPEKLRPWLCGIARNLSGSLHRDNQREPAHAAVPLESIDLAATDEPSPATLAMNQDDEALVWRALANLPEAYREPLVLYYRQNQSVENVAAALDLSEDTVKQRLSRGRKMLQEQVLDTVEGTLTRTNPGPSFTSKVMAALPMAASSTGKSAIAATAIKSALATGAKGILGAFLGPATGLLIGWMGAEEGIKNLQSRGGDELSVNISTASKRKDVLKAIAEEIVSNAVWLGLLYVVWLFDETNTPIKAFAYVILGFLFIGQRVTKDFHELWTLTAQVNPDQPKIRSSAWVAGWVATEFGLVAVLMYEMERNVADAFFFMIVFPFLVMIFIFFAILLAEPILSEVYGFLIVRCSPATRDLLNKPVPPEINAGATAKSIEINGADDKKSGLIIIQKSTAAPFEYRSQRKFLGLPLIHINSGKTSTGTPRVAKGWIAAGGRAVGLIAIGGSSAGVLSMGFASIGFAGVGGLIIAPYAAGCVALGYRALGGVAVGNFAVGGLALAWQAAYGGLAIAHGSAGGGLAFAGHVNDLASQTLMATDGFLSFGKAFLHYIVEMILLQLVYMWAVLCIKGIIKKKWLGLA